MPTELIWILLLAAALVAPALRAEPAYPYREDIPTPLAVVHILSAYDFDQDKEREFFAERFIENLMAATPDPIFGLFVYSLNHNGPLFPTRRGRTWEDYVENPALGGWSTEGGAAREPRDAVARTIVERAARSGVRLRPIDDIVPPLNEFLREVDAFVVKAEDNGRPLESYRVYVIIWAHDLYFRSPGKSLRAVAGHPHCFLSEKVGGTRWSRVQPPQGLSVSVEVRSFQDTGRPPLGQESMDYIHALLGGALPGEDHQRGHVEVIGERRAECPQHSPLSYVAMTDPTRQLRVFEGCEQDLEFAQPPSQRLDCPAEDTTASVPQRGTGSVPPGGASSGGTGGTQSRPTSPPGGAALPPSQAAVQPFVQVTSIVSETATPAGPRFEIVVESADVPLDGRLALALIEPGQAVPDKYDDVASPRKVILQAGRGARSAPDARAGQHALVGYATLGDLCAPGGLGRFTLVLGMPPLGHRVAIKSTAVASGCHLPPETPVSFQIAKIRVPQ